MRDMAVDAIKLSAEPIYSGTLSGECSAASGPAHIISAMSIGLTRDHENPLVAMLYCESCKKVVEVSLDRIKIGGPK